MNYTYKSIDDILLYVNSQEEFEDTKGVNQNPYIEEEQTTQWPNEKVQKDKQRSIIHTYKIKDRVTRTPLKINVGISYLQEESDI